MAQRFRLTISALACCLCLFQLGAVEDGAFDVGAFSSMEGAFRAEGAGPRGCLPGQPKFMLWAGDMNGNGDLNTGWTDSDPIESGGSKEWVNTGSISGNMEQATASKRPIWDAAVTQLNGAPGVFFDGSDDFARHDGVNTDWNFTHLNSDTPWTCHWVVAQDATPPATNTVARTRTSAGGQASGFAQLIGTSGTKTDFRMFNNSAVLLGQAVSSGTPLAADQGHLYTVVFRGSGDATPIELYVDGSSVATDTSVSTTPNAPAVPLTMGREDASSTLEGWVGLLVCYDKAHDTSTIGTVKTCLESASYYGGTFPL